MLLQGHDVTRLALQAILNQTTAKLGGYLGLDPAEQAQVVGGTAARLLGVSTG